jgi:hypothetical protein
MPGVRQTAGGVVQTVAGVIQTSTVPIVDSFEDGDVSEYSDDIGSYSVVNESTITPSAIDGTKVLSADSANTELEGYSGDGLQNYFAKGEELTAYSWAASDANSHEVKLWFSLNNNGNRYQVLFLYADDTVKLRRVDDSQSNTVKTLASDSNATLATSTWHRIVIQRDDGSTFGGSDGDLNVEVIDNSDGSTVTSLSANNTLLNDDGIGFEIDDRDGAAYWDYLHISDS